MNVGHRRVVRAWLHLCTGSQQPMTDNSPSTDDTARPQEVLDLYLETRREEVSEQTLQAHQYRLNHFVRWCNEQGIEDVGELDGRQLHEYRLWRREDGNLNVVSLQTQLSTLRVFLKFCEKIDIVENGLFDKVQVPSLAEGQDRRNSILPSDRAEQILEYLSTFEYATFDHTMFLLLWRTGMRIGALRGLDLDDYHAAEGRLKVRHRPQGGTSLKLGENGERTVALASETVVVLNDYIERTRYDVTDKNGRDPLLTTKHGRPGTTTLRRRVYRVTQPCQRLNECPHNTSMQECEHEGYTKTAGCPSSTPPHDIRRGSITHWLKNDVPRKAVGDRMNVGEDVLQQHYDQRSEDTRAEQRRKYLNDI